jgi:quercetin dioxygenase-like cupin family protein
MSNSNTHEIAERLKGLRTLLEIEPEEMAAVTGLSTSDYLAFEAGNKDFSVTMLYNCSGRFGIDVTELLTGNSPTLHTYSLVRAGEGVLTSRRSNFSYRHLAENFSGRTTEPFYVTVPYSKEAEAAPIALSSHKGQEMDYILKGSLKVVVGGGKPVTLNVGDTLYYDSSLPHGMIAVGGEACEFLAIVIKDVEE